jgi:hypothetical protein
MARRFPSFSRVSRAGTRFLRWPSCLWCSAPQGIALAALAAAAMIPLLNVGAVSVLSVYASGTGPSVSGVMKSLAVNPFVLSSAVGITLNLTGLGLAAPIEQSLELIGRGALAVAYAVCRCRAGTGETAPCRRCRGRCHNGQAAADAGLHVGVDLRTRRRRAAAGGRHRLRRCSQRGSVLHPGPQDGR